MFNKIPSKVNYIISKLISNNYKAYLCGGAVRDLVMEIEPKDYDITTSATPEQIKEVFKDYEFINTGIEFGSIIINIYGELYDITTFRADGKYSDSRRPDSITYNTEAKEDVIRRDFTINGLLYNKYEGIVDLVGGLEDIDNGLIRAIGNPKDRFNEDNLRVLRAIRFALRYGFNIEENTLKAMLETEIKVSKERIYKELKEILPNLYKLKDIYSPGNLLRIILSFLIYEDNQIIDYLNLVKLLLIDDRYKDDFEASLLTLFDVAPKLEDKFLKYLNENNPLCLESKYIKTLKNAIYIKQNLRNSLEGGIEKNYFLRKTLKKHSYKEILKVLNTTFNKHTIAYLEFDLRILYASLSGYKTLAINGTDIMNEFKIEGKIVGDCLRQCEYEVLHIPALNNKEALFKICKDCINKQEVNI